MSFTPNELQLPYAEFKALADGRRGELDPTWREWLGQWDMWDLACSPMPDRERRALRYQHSLEWATRSVEG